MYFKICAINLRKLSPTYFEASVYHNLLIGKLAVSLLDE